MVSMKSDPPRSALVYSTDIGRTCPECRLAVAACSCRRTALRQPAGDGIVRLALETKGRKGKGVTVIRGLALDATALTQLSRRMKAASGAGGTCKDGIVEVQGDHRSALAAFLSAEGWTVKLSGG